MYAYLLTYPDSQFKLLQVPNGYKFNINSRLKISPILRCQNKRLELGLQVFDCRKLGLCADREVITLFHRLASGDVSDPCGIVNHVRDLDDASGINLSEYTIHQRDLLDCHVGVVDYDMVTDVVWVLDEEKNA